MPNPFVPRPAPPTDPFVCPPESNGDDSSFSLKANAGKVKADSELLEVIRTTGTRFGRGLLATTVTAPLAPPEGIAKHSGSEGVVAG